MSEASVNSLVIRTPEGVTFELPLAGPVSRFFAWFIDITLVGVICSAIAFGVSVAGSIAPGFAQAAIVLLYFVVGIGYGIALEWFWRGQTVGKRLLKLRVMDESGLRLRFSQVAIRNLLRFVDSLPFFYLVGGTACLLSRRWQRLGDFAANTIVVRARTEFSYDLDRIMSGKYNSFRRHPHLEARLRRSVTPEEASLVLQAVMRRDELDDESRLELMREVAGYFKNKVSFPEDAVFGLTDEQYLRNVADSLFRQR